MSALSFLGSLIIISYVVVIADVFKIFKLPQAGSSYFESPYWVGMPVSYGILTTVAQMLAIIGLFLWFRWKSETYSFRCLVRAIH